ncbi:DUF4238 domain-containing protein [Tenacibaculum aquimarinum]|uniref:DUF4238 domain-containing protein n=1 Tax=Tenacibaculum aquimarinum TaxID=2910675 RepID=UPI001F0A50F0|nr:DUF4238 domain-containing protein [Tenacibaculum aquimarinum]MCH3883714.1 DUF4238 domain-containing protein [Tenacibaculum aquimarinum]
MQQVKDQHTVPKCYLKNFSEDGNNIFRKFKKVTKEDLTNIELKKPTSLKKATTKEHFYTVEKGTETMVIESIFYSREIENYYPKYYDLLINPKISKLESRDDRSRILMCLLSLHCRTPKQFNYFFKSIPENLQDRIDLIKEEYKTSHIGNTLINFIQTHEYKTITIVKINDSSEFITSDNPVLILNPKGELINHKFKEQFNKDNVIVIPIDHKHCCILKNATDKNGISIDEKVFYNGIKRIEENCNFAWEINAKIIKSADLVCYGREKYIKAFFSIYKFID